MRIIPTFAAIIIFTTAAQAQNSDAWFGTASQGQIEGYIQSSDGTADLATGCTLHDKDQLSGLTVFINDSRPQGRVSIQIDGSDPMRFDLVQGEIKGSDPGRTALFNAMIAGTLATMTMDDGRVFSFSLNRSSIYLVPCL